MWGGKAHLRLFLASVGTEPMIFLEATERGAVWRVEAAGVEPAGVEPEREARDTWRLPWACWTILLVSKDTLSSLL